MFIANLVLGEFNCPYIKQNVSPYVEMFYHKENNSNLFRVHVPFQHTDKILVGFSNFSKTLSGNYNNIPADFGLNAPLGTPEDISGACYHQYPSLPTNAIWTVAVESCNFITYEASFALNNTDIFKQQEIENLTMLGGTIYLAILGEGAITEQFEFPYFVSHDLLIT